MNVGVQQGDEARLDACFFEQHYPKGEDKMPKKKVTEIKEVKTQNPLTNGSCDEKAARDVLNLIKEKDIQIIDLKLMTAWTLAAFFHPGFRIAGMDDITRSIWVDGIGFDGSSIRGFQKIQESDMIMIPDRLLR